MALMVRKGLNPTKPKTILGSCRLQMTIRCDSRSVQQIVHAIDKRFIAQCTLYLLARRFYIAARPPR